VLIDRHWHERAPNHPPDFRAPHITGAVECILTAAGVS
jgi:hypothetical protein